MAGTRKYLCQFRGRCPAFNQDSQICLTIPWTCDNWEMHLKNLREGKKPITETRNISLVNILSKKEDNGKIDEELIKEISINHKRYQEEEKKRRKISRLLRKEKKTDVSESL